MKVLLTIEEYRERIIHLVMDVANKTINPNGDDYFKFSYISWLVEECLTDHICLVDVCNQMFINTFCRDRNGKMWCKENIRQIDEKEAKEFNSQEWYAKFNEKARKSWSKTYEMISFTYIQKDDEDYETSADFFRDVHFIKEAVAGYFWENGNESYHIALEVFAKLYGYEYEVDRDFKYE